MKIGKIGKLQLHLKARSRARLCHVSALLPLVITSLTPHRTLADGGHVPRRIMADPPNQSGGVKGPFAVKPVTRGVVRMVRFLAQSQNGAKLGGMLRDVCSRALFIAALITGQTAWAQQGSQDNTGPLPPPPPSAAPFVESAPFLAFKHIEGQNASVRTAFDGIGPGGTKIQVRDVVVAPDGSVQFDPIKGQVVIDTRSGEGLAKTGGLSTTLDTTKVASMAVNGKIEVQNQGDVPLVMMMYVVEGR
jgi:hypothetical protein